MALADEAVTAATKATPREISQMERELEGWAVINDEGMQKLVKEYRFEDFAQAMVFVNKVGKVAEDHDHHPEITFTWGRATVRWWTHSAGGLSRNDFIMAAKTDTVK
jgi:4a-hydroxytetrahydrobiopterin dehydratase